MKKILIVFMMIAAVFTTAFADRARLKELVEVEIETDEPIDLEEFGEIVSELKEKQENEKAAANEELQELENEKERLREELEQLEQELEELEEKKAESAETIEERAVELVKEAMEEAEFSFDEDEDSFDEEFEDFEEINDLDFLDELEEVLEETFGDNANNTIEEKQERSRPVASRESVDFVPMHISVIPGLNFPIGSSHRVSTPLALSPLFSGVHDVRGVQVSGLISSAEGDVAGSQWSGIGNIAGGEVNGVQGSGIFNFAGGYVNGIQLAGVFNMAPEGVKGFQGSGLFNMADGDVAGAQFAGIFNTVDGSIAGCQGAGILNISEGETSWFQGAGILNISGGVMRGLQVSGIANIAHEAVFGFQLSSIVNIAGDVNGGQIGLVNVGKNVKGVQVGLVNISDDIQGIPIGLINISKNGIFNLTGWVDNTGFSYVGLQQGIGGLYWLAYAGGKTGLDFSTFSDFSAGVGFGFQQKLGPIVIDTDISGKYGFVEKTYDNGNGNNAYYLEGNVIPSGRVAAGLQFGKRLGIYAGATFDAYLPGVTRGNQTFAAGEKSSFTVAGQAVDVFTKYFVAIKL